MQADLARHEDGIQGEREAARLKDVFLSTLSHEIKTPLSLIPRYTELLEDKYADESLGQGRSGLRGFLLVNLRGGGRGHLLHA